MSAVKNEQDYDPYYMYGDCAEREGSVSRWAQAYQNDFIARMIWSVTDSYEEANHHPRAVLNNDTTAEILDITAKPGETVPLTAEGSFDPDSTVLNTAGMYIGLRERIQRK